MKLVAVIDSLNRNRNKQKLRSWHKNDSQSLPDLIDDAVGLSLKNFAVSVKSLNSFFF